MLRGGVAALARRGAASPALVRCASTIPRWLMLSRDGPFVTVSMAAPPVNTLTPALLDELVSTFACLEDDSTVSGVVLASDLKCFSSGLDLAMFATAPRSDLVKYWTQFQELYLRLHGSRLTTVAAVEGHAPAGGCILAMMCDRRYMTPEAKLGLTETLIGLVPPNWILDLMAYVVGDRNAERYASDGAMLGADEALRVGLVDGVGPYPRADATRALRDSLRPDAAARHAVKRHFRAPRLAALEAIRADDSKTFVERATSEPAKTMIDLHLQTLRAKKT
ncbi:ClpP/crotonase-like domain-containing protein [Pelagophyceae sp. CCMP2097]|nr:ClpP/crotonase-like domain-containing protein [Pelagophyceae sp. CCMP2097]